MEIKLSKNSEGIHILELSGNLDLLSSDQLKDYVMKMLKTRIECFIISVKNIESINSAGIGALIFISSTLRKLNCTLVMHVPEGPVLEALEVSKLKNYFQIVQSLKEAVELASSAGKAG